MTEKASRPSSKGISSRSAQAPGVVEEIEVRGHIVDSLLLPKILDRILLMGGTLRDPRVQDRSAPHPTRAMRGSRSGPTVTRRSTAILGDLVEHGASPMHPEDATIVAGRHRRRVSRGLLQHDQPAHAGPLQRAAGSTSTTRRWTAASWSIAASGMARCIPMIRVDDRHADRGRPRGGARAAGRAVARSQPVRLHELDGLERKAQVDQRAGRGRRDPGDPRRGEEGACWWAGRRSCTPARRATSPG